MSRSLRFALTAISCFVLVTACAAEATWWYSDDEIGDGGPPEAGENGLEAPSGQGNGNGPAPVGHLSFQPPFGPFTISIDTNFKIKVTATSPEFTTPFGVFKVGVSAGPDSFTGKDNKPLPPKPEDVTDLIVCVQGGGPESCEGRTVRTGRKLRVDIEGRSTQFIETGRVVIEVLPGTPIKISDDGPSGKAGPPGRARIGIEQFKFHERSADAEVDFERSHARTKNDLAYNHITGELKTINGTKLAKVAHFGGNTSWGSGNLEKADLPGENDCRQATDWRDGFNDDDFPDDLTIACVQTADNDLGYIVVGRVADRKPTAYRVYTYTWVR